MEEFQAWKEREEEVTYMCYVKDQSAYHPKSREGTNNSAKIIHFLKGC